MLSDLRFKNLVKSLNNSDLVRFLRFPENDNFSSSTIFIALVKWSTQLTRMSNMLAEDPAVLANRRDEILPTSRYSFEEAERIFTNNMDAGRYLSTASQQFSEFFIPLDHPPRRVSTLAARQNDNPR